MHGDLLVGSFAGGQIGENRPFAGASRYRTPSKGCICLRRIDASRQRHHRPLRLQRSALRRLTRLAIWWNPPDAEEALAFANINPCPFALCVVISI
jgi:hypothetical protein